MAPSRIVSPLALSAALVLAPFASSPAAAQTTAPASGAAPASLSLGALYLRGEGLLRRSENTASSAAVLEGEDLAEDTTLTTVTEAVAEVPNVLVYSSVGTAPTIRGQDSQGPSTGALAFFGGTTPRTSIVFDGRALSYNEFVYGGSNPWDVEGIEVYRGPQTVAQGANSIAGAIIVRSNRPSFTPEGVVQVQGGNLNARRLSLAYSAPLSEDLAFRIALDRSSRDNFITYTNPAFVQDDHFSRDLSSFMGRASLLWRPADSAGLEVLLSFSHNRSNRPTSEAANLPYEDLINGATTSPVWNQNTSNATLAITHDFANGFVLNSTTQYTDNSVRRRMYPANYASADIDTRNYSNETRVTYGQDGDILFATAGIYVSRTEQRDVLNQDPFLLSDIYSTFDDDRRSYGAFGEATWRIADRWSLTGGLRLQRDDIHRQGIAYEGANPALPYANARVNFSQTYDAVLPRLSLAYEANPNLTFGGLISRGYNPGGVTLNFTTGQYVEYQPEYLWNYELFSRATLLEGRLRLNANLFRMDITDAQRFVAVMVSGVPQSYTVNAERARSTGLELSADWDVSARLRMNAGVGLLRTRFEEFSAMPGREGNVFAMAPSRTLTLGASWEVSDGLTLSGQVRHVAGYFSEDGNAEVYRIDPLTLANLRLDYVTRSGVELFGYVNNIFDTRQPTFLQVNRVVGGLEGYMTTPREFGIGVRYRF